MCSSVCSRLRLLASLAILACTFVSLPARSAGSEPVVSWFFMYPMFNDGIDVLPQSGANAATIMAGGWSMEAEEGKFNSDRLDWQITYAEKNKLSLTMISESNPLYSPGWLNANAKAAGELVRNTAGVEGSIPSITSKVFGDAQEDLIRKTVEFIKQRDKSRVVAYYHPGAEWWFPLADRYGTGDIARFREWLKTRYVSVDKLNATWGSSYHSFDEAPAPKIDWGGGGKGSPEMSYIICSDDGSKHCSWSLGASATQANAAPESYIHVTPGGKYKLSFQTRMNADRGIVLAEIPWTKAEGGGLLTIDTAKPIRSTNGWQTLSMDVTAPKEAGRAWVLLKFIGIGTAEYDNLRFIDAGTGKNLAPNPDMEVGGGDMPDYWSFQNWTGGDGPKTEYLKSGGVGNSRCVRVTVPPSTGSYRNVDAAVNDWCTYWYQAGAEYINGLSGTFKKYDTTRPTVTYLTYSFAYPAEWDYSQYNAIAPDEVGMRGTNIDIFGMQTCAADTDPYRITACLDLMRKYGKPLWIVDLIDFTSGVHIGYERMNKVTQSAIQHGATGLVYCGWNIPFAMDYSFYPNWTTADQKKMTTGAITAIKLMKGMSVDSRIALVQPILPASPLDKEGFKNDYRSFIGWYKILEGMRRTFDIVTLRELEYGSPKLAKYKWIMVPDCAYIPRKSLAALESYAKSGRKLITSGRFAQFDEIRRPLKSKLTPMMPDYGKAYTGSLMRDTHAGNTPPLFLWRADTPTTQRALTDGKSALAGLLAKARIGEDIELLGGSSDIRIVTYQGKGAQAVYLVNMGDGEAKGLKLKLKSGVKGAEAYTDLVKTPASIRKSGAWTEVAVPAFKTSCIVKTSK